MAAVELHSRHQIKAIMPIIVHDEDGTEFSWSLTQRLANVEHKTTADICRQHLERENPLSTERPSLQNAEDIVQEVSAGADTGVSVNGIVTSVLRYQGVIVPQRTEVRLFYVHVCLCCLYSEHLIASTSIKRGENCRRLTTVLIDSSIR